VALTYAARHPGHPRALVLDSTMARFDLQRIVEGFRQAGGDDVAAIADRAYSGGSVSDEEWARCWKFVGPWVPGVEEDARTIVNRELNEAAGDAFHSFDVVGRLGVIDCPVLVCVGELDAVTPVAAAREIVEALPEGRVRLEVLEGGGHFSWKDVPARYWPLLDEFVAQAG
jgi:pimeloyl-ACP methyl ester carboxylesterase